MYLRDVEWTLAGLPITGDLVLEVGGRPKERRREAEGGLYVAMISLPVFSICVVFAMYPETDVLRGAADSLKEAVSDWITASLDGSRMLEGSL